MILGMGLDIVDIGRIEQSLERFGQRFVDRLFTEHEQVVCDSRANRAACYAKRFAAKEACSKALGTGVRGGILFKDFQISSTRHGQPKMILTGQAKKQLEKLTPAGLNAVIHVSISDDGPMAQAQVIIEANPPLQS